MELAKKFQALNLHSESHDKADNEETPFVATARLREDKTGTLYGCGCNPYLPPEGDQVVATVGSRFLHVYSLPRDSHVLKPRYSLTLDSKDEDLYTVTWCYDTYDAKNGNPPYKIVTGGFFGQLYIIDAQSGKLCNFQRIETPGGPVNDLRTCPTNSNLVLCGTKDSTVRIFHCRNDACLITMGGFDTHIDQVLSVDWAANGEYILSCGFDHQIMKWDMSADHVKRHLNAACKALECGKRNMLNQTTPLQYEEHAPLKKLPELPSVKLDNYAPTTEVKKVIDQYVGIISKPPGCLLTIYEPTDVCSDLHIDYVDCIRILGTSDYIFTKGCGKESSISLWRFGGPKGTDAKRLVSKPFTAQTRLATLPIEHGNPWFIKFEIDPKRLWLVCGAASGYINFFNLKTPTAPPVMSVQISKEIVRQVSFSSDGRIMVAVTERAEAIRFDRVPASVQSKDLPNLPLPKY